MPVWDNIHKVNPGHYGAGAADSGGAFPGGGGMPDVTGGVGKGASWLWNNALNPTNDFNAGYLKPDADISGALKQWALTGQGPSAAQGLIAQERAKNIAAAASSAKSAPGMSLSGQQRLANMGQSRAVAQAASTGATLRAQEQQQAMQNALDQYRTTAQAYADAMRANAQVAAENAGARRGILGGLVKGITGGLSI